MKKILSATIIFFFLIFSSLIITSCSERDGTSSCFPVQQINAELFINGYANLIKQQWDYTKGEAGTGYPGLIIFDSGNGYIVYDRNAPHLCPDTNTTLEVIKDTDGFFKIHCPKDGAKWLLQTGAPQNSQAKGIPKTYPNYLKNGILYIYN